MKTYEREFELERAARKSGGDRYQEVVPIGEVAIIGTMYVLQTASRPDGMPTTKLKLTLEVE